MKTLYRCTDCQEYTLQEDECPHCGGTVKYPYPAKFSLIKERKYRYLIRKKHHEDEKSD